MRKPYISTSNYINKMSDYKDVKDKEDEDAWNVIWDALFYRFINKNKKQFNGGASFYLRNLTNFEKKNKKEQDKILKIGNKFVKSV